MAEMSHLMTLGIFVVIVALSWRDMAQSSTPDEGKPSKDIPRPKLSHFAGPTVRFMFCYSWGYRKVFEQFAHTIQQKYPQLRVEGDNYPPPSLNQMIAQFLSFAKLALIVLIISGQNPFEWCNMATPSVFSWCIQNKIYACMMLFFISNAIESQLVSTGAFEVTFNDIPVWSKLETGRIPSPQEMFQIIDHQMRLSG